MSAPAVAASIASSNDWHSTSIFCEKPAAFRASFTAFVMEPLDQIWLSFNMTIWLKSKRCVAAPPTSRPYFSTIRNPGVVFLVPATCPFQPRPLARSTAARDSVATPEHRLSVFSAVRSPRRISRTLPVTMAKQTFSPTISLYVPSTASSSIHSILHPITSNTFWKNGFPAKTPDDFINSLAFFSSVPTTNPPTSNDGISSVSQPWITCSRFWGSRALKSV
mmetsp:Transcript_12338/g.25481  ORF Transcript_12338/g.25481 Transcript_12338/m.25481 type:complete len:221 (+) Transcript_12338:255-917(+)